MALKPYTDKSSMTLIISVQNDGSPRQIAKDLDDALTLVEESLDDRDTSCYTIDVSGTWRPGDGKVQPWDDPYFTAWRKLVEMPEMRAPLSSWLTRVATFVKKANETGNSCLSESDTTQFGEVPASLLAAADRRYLPVYINLLMVWDLDHAVSQLDVSKRLIKLHGNNSATKELVDYVDAWS